MQKSIAFIKALGAKRVKYAKYLLVPVTTSKTLENLDFKYLFYSNKQTVATNTPGILNFSCVLVLMTIYQ